jgi:hypothetical protein
MGNPMVPRPMKPIDFGNGILEYATRSVVSCQMSVGLLLVLFGLLSYHVGAGPNCQA